MITPLLHGVLILPDDVEKKTESGIIIPDQVTDKERKAVEYGKIGRASCRERVLRLV